MLGEIIPLGQLAIAKRLVGIAKTILNYAPVMHHQNSELEIYIVLK